MEENHFPAWSWSVDQCLREYDVKLDKGLSTYDTEQRRERYGWNELKKEKGKPFWKLVLEQFDDALVKILIVAALISFMIAYLDKNESGEISLKAYMEPLVILLILVLNAIVGVWQERNAENALEALKELQCESAKVLRDGRLVPDLPSRELVPGDIVHLSVGDKVPADMRVAVLKTSTLRAEQSSLTGESMPALKNTAALSFEDCDLQSKENMVFAGTTVVNGSCICIVAATGMRTEIGKIQSQIHEASLEEHDTPLKRKLDEFGRRLTTSIGFVCLVVWIINYKHFLSWEFNQGKPSSFRFSLEKCTYYFKIAVSLAVAAIPEGLPAVITTSLALGTKKMAQKNAIVRKLPSVETLGCTTVICSDKTGTLTTNQMSVTEFFTLGGKATNCRVFQVEGTTYDPKAGRIVDWDCYNMDANLQAMAQICALCNDAGIFFNGQVLGATGLPTEAALKVLVEKMGVPDLKARNKIRDMHHLAGYMINSSSVKLASCEWWIKRSKRLATLEFDRVRKSMSVIVREPTGSNRLLVKGAVESLLERTSHVQLADGSIAPIDDSSSQQTEILSRRGGLVFSRAEPRHKQDIVRMLKDMQEIVAMTGDGVNDAPALKLADIGIAMGITGTEVAKEASDMVLADDNFSTIVSAVAEGRSIYNNMKAFIRYMISSNVGEVICIFLTAALGIPESLIPVQLLWVNLVTDGPPATALGFNPQDADVMLKPPRKNQDSLINRWVLLRYLVIGSYVGIATVGVFILWYTQPSFLGINLTSDGHTLVSFTQLTNWEQCSTWSDFTVSPFEITKGNILNLTNHCDYFTVGKTKAATLSLSVLVAIEMFNALNALSEERSLISIPPWKNPWLLVAISVSIGLHCLIMYISVLGNAFGIVPLGLEEWLLVVVVSAPVVFVDEALKFVGRSRGRAVKKMKMT